MDNESGTGAPFGTSPADEEFLRSVIDNLPVGLFCKDVGNDLRMRLWNKKNAEITGFESKQALGKTDEDLFPDWQAKRFREDDKRVLDAGRGVDIEEEEVDSGNMERVILRTKKVPIRDSAGRLYILGICEDITERKQTKEALVKAMDELKATQLQLIQAEKLESIGRLAAGVAHEVKNPLALLLLGVEYLSGGIDPEDENIPVILEEMREAIQRADKIMRGMVDFSSTRKLDLKPVSLNELIEKALLMLRHEFTKNSVEVVTECDPDIEPIKMDETKMEQVIINLMLNAVHAMADSSEKILRVKTELGELEETPPDPGTREIRRRRGDRVVKMKISDTGSGIRPEQVEKVFDPFFTTKETGHGTGLGLTVVRKIVELHRGHISMKNISPRGVTVCVSLPFD